MGSRVEGENSSVTLIFFSQNSLYSSKHRNGTISPCKGLTIWLDHGYAVAPQESREEETVASGTMARKKTENNKGKKKNRAAS